MTQPTRRTKRRTVWAIATAALFDQNGYPFLCPTRRAAKNWCANGEYPVQAILAWTAPASKRRTQGRKK